MDYMREANKLKTIKPKGPGAEIVGAKVGKKDGGTLTVEQKDKEELVLAATATFKNEINGKKIVCSMKHPKDDEESLTISFDFGEKGLDDHQSEIHGYFCGQFFNVVND